MTASWQEAGRPRTHPGQTQRGRTWAPWDRDAGTRPPYRAATTGQLLPPFRHPASRQTSMPGPFLLSPGASSPSNHPNQCHGNQPDSGSQFSTSAND